MNAADLYDLFTPQMPFEPVVDIEDDDADDPLQSAVWMAQDLGISMPPIPQVHAGALKEIELGRIFATAPALAALTGPAAIVAATANGRWPVNGLAFGFAPSGLGGTWFYVLVGEQQIVSISLRVRFVSEGGEHAAALITSAHALLAGYLADDACLKKAINPLPGLDGSPRRIVCYTNEGGAGRELHAHRVADDAVSFRPQTEVFVPHARGAAAAEAEVVMFFA